MPGDAAGGPALHTLTHGAPLLARAGLTSLAILAGCDDPICDDLRAELRSRYEPYGDPCDEGPDCPSGACDTGRTSVCRCESDGECRSGLCLDSLCANPDHDLRLTPGLAERGAEVQALCPGTDRAARRQAADCADVLAFLEKAGCAACDEASLRLCACRGGGALHACLLQAAGAARSAPDADSDLGDAQVRICEVQAEDLRCDDHLGAISSPCADAAAGPAECRSGLCRDSDPANNSGPTGDHPDDWICVDSCATDLDCPKGFVCDPSTALADPPPGPPYTCRRRP